MIPILLQSLPQRRHLQRAAAAACFHAHYSSVTVSCKTLRVIASLSLHCRVPISGPATVAAHIPVATLRTRSDVAAAAALAASQRFEDLCPQLLRTVASAVQPMTAINAGMRIVPSGPFALSIELGSNLRSGGGVISLTGDPATQRVTMMCPKSGTHVYKYSAASKAWIGESDGHFLVEMLTRDIIFFCKGFPAF